MADHSAQAAAMALAAGRPARAAALEAVPGWPERALRVRSGAETVRVSLEPPSLLRLVGTRIAVEGRAAVVAGPAGGGREGDADGRGPGPR
jgi:hypothetical protein